MVGVAHEAFLSAWPPLAEAITAASTALRARRQIEQAAADWAEHGQRPERLWERGQLAAALADTGARLQAGNQPPPSCTRRGCDCADPLAHRSCGSVGLIWGTGWWSPTASS